MPRILFLILISAGALACNRQITDSGTRSTIAFRVPKSPQEFAKAGGDATAFATIPTNRKACYGFSVSGPGITNNGHDTCTPDTGVIAGFKSAGEELSADVPRGLHRQIDVYMYLMKPGDTGACPAMGVKFSAAQLVLTYYIGGASDVTLQKDVEPITIIPEFQGVSQYLAHQLNYDATCTAGVVPIPNRTGLHLDADRTVASGGSIKLYGRVGKAASGTKLSGGNYILKVVK
jgi:hypothetical protein